MINRESIRLETFSYDQIFIVTDRNSWEDCLPFCTRERDLILCIDFALLRELKKEGFHVAFIDHLVTSDILNELNLRMNDFLYKWCKNTSGDDLLAYDCFNIGEALLLEIITDVTYFCHYFFNILAIKSIQYNKIWVASDDITILSALNKAGFSFQKITASRRANKPVYYFPIKQWMDETISRDNWKTKLKKVYEFLLDNLMPIVDFSQRNRLNIYIQDYHPTNSIINGLTTKRGLTLTLPSYKALSVFFNKTTMFLKLRKVVYRKFYSKRESGDILKRYKNADKYKWEYKGYIVSDYLYETIDKLVETSLPSAVSKARSIKLHFKKYPLNLMIPVTDLWLENRLIINYCKKNKIPVFFVANGLLNTPYLNEGRDSDFVNCYSESTKEDYFYNAPNAIALGDPRMDKYAGMDPKSINREDPVIIIGAAGYDVTNINSYLSYEFDFLYDILDSIQRLNSSGYKSSVILKVRANGYSELYREFINEYYPTMKIEIIQHLSFYETIQRADLYISIFSQTIFEASSLGIPSIYYKKDTQLFYRPFDGQSELVTAYNVNELVEKIKLFYQSAEIYAPLMEKNVLEKYVGPLDGKNTMRNLDFIEGLLYKY